jgi:hypothetical protein
MELTENTLTKIEELIEDSNLDAKRKRLGPILQERRLGHNATGSIKDMRRTNVIHMRAKNTKAQADNTVTGKGFFGAPSGIKPRGSTYKERSHLFAS